LLATAVPPKLLPLDRRTKAASIYVSGHIDTNGNAPGLLSANVELCECRALEHQCVSHHRHHGK
jgi:hypothetical protein